MLVVTKKTFNTLSAKTKAELLSAVLNIGGKPIIPSVGPSGGEHIDWNGVVDLSPGDVEEFIDDATSMYQGTVEGLRIIAEHGPIVHHEFLEEKLRDPSGKPWFDDLAVFRRSTTRRVRSVTGGKRDFLLGWDDWSKQGEGYYGVTPETHRSLRVYFNLA